MKQSIKEQKNNIVNIYDNYIINGLYFLQNGGTFLSLTKGISSNESDITKYNFNGEIYDLECIHIGFNASHFERPYIHPYIMICDTFIIGSIINITSVLSPYFRETFINKVPEILFKNNKNCTGGMFVIGDNSCNFITGGLCNNNFVYGGSLSFNDDLIFFQNFDNFTCYFNSHGIFFMSFIQNLTNKVLQSNITNILTTRENILGVNISYLCKPISFNNINIYNIIVGFSGFSLSNIYSSITFEITTNFGYVIIEFVYNDSEWHINLKYNPGINVHYYQSL